MHEVYAPFVRDIPDHPAFVEGGRSWSYRQFSEAVDAAAKDLSDLGIRPGDRVMIASENSVALGAMLFAASKLDAWGIAVNPRLSAREIDLIGTHSGARRVLFNSALSKEAADHASRVGAKIDAVGPFGGIGIGPLNADAQAEPVEKDGARQVAGLLYTSGTTGAPKGVMLSHRNLLFTAKTSGILRQSGPADRIYGVLPMSHIVGYSILLIATLMHGGTLYVVAKADPAALAHAIAEEGITSLFGVPATYQRLLEHKAVKGIQQLERGKLRIMAVAGAPLDLDLKKRIEDEFGIPLLNNYGITECSPGLSGVRSEHPVSDESVGPFLPGIEHRIVDRQGKKVATGEVGELHVRGPNVMLGYYRAPEQTAAAIDRPGMVQHRGSRPGERRGPSLHRRPHQGTHHPLRLQRLPRRGGGGAERARPGRAIGRRRTTGRWQRGGRRVRAASPRRQRQRRRPEGVHGPTAHFVQASD